MPFRPSKAYSGVRAQRERAEERPALCSMQVNSRQPTVGPGETDTVQVAGPGESGTRQVITPQGV